MRLSTAFLVAALSVPTIAHADTAALASVCGQLIGSQVGECHAAARGRFIDRDAAQACGQLIGSQVVSCVSVIAGKDYDPGETGNCGQLIGSQVITCLGQTGRPHVDAPPPRPVQPYPQPYTQPYPPAQPEYPPRRGPMTVAEIRSEIAASLESLRASDPVGTERRLRRLLRDLR